MPKKGRHGQRSKPEASYATPTSDLLDMAGDTPELAPARLPEEHETPLFSFDSDVERTNATGREQDVAPVGGAYTDAPREDSDEGEGRPSPLALSPMPRPTDAVPIPAGDDEERVVGHTRAPVLVVEPNMLESISRTVRSYVPNSIPIPNAIPSPPSVSRPLSFGFFTGPSSTSPASRQQAYSPPIHRASSRASSSAAGGSAYSPGMGYSPPTYDEHGRQRRASGYGGDLAVWSEQGRLGARAGADVPALELDGREHRARSNSAAGTDVTRYPGGKVQEDEVVFAGWDEVDGKGYDRPRRLFFVGYTSGLQVWDCTDLSTVSEVLNLSADWGRVIHAGVLPDPQSAASDPFASERPLIGIVQEDNDLGSFIIYSLATHRIVRTLDISNVISFSANDLFIVLSTSLPPTLHIISSVTFKTLLTISSTQLVPYTAPLTDKQHQHQPVLSTHLETSQQTLPREPVPVPVFALHHRLLAFASPPSSSDTPAGASSQTRARRLSAAGVTSGPGTGAAINFAGVSVTQADLGNAALKVGSTVLSGMRSLGGFAVSKARAHMAGAPTSATAPPSGSQPHGAGGLSKMFYSRSAPAASEGYASTAGSMPGTPGVRRASFGHGSVVGDPMMASAALSAAPVASQGAQVLVEHCVRVLDLAPLLGGGASRRPRVVAEFAPARSQPTTRLAFTKDGTAIAVAPKDAQAVQVFKLRPSATALGPFVAGPEEKTGAAKQGGRRAGGTQQAPRATEKEETTLPMEAPWLAYELRRGRTSAVIEHVEGDGEGRWVAVGTRNRTVHVFAVNPYGGKPDERSHLEARVRNGSELAPLGVQVDAIARLRAVKIAAHEPRPSAPLAFTFLKTNQSSLPSSLLPAPTPYLTPKSPALSLPPSPAQRPLSSPSQSPRTVRPTNYQDMLVFDPHTGTLSLRRCTLERRVREPNSLSVNSSVPVLGGTSISLPSMSPISRFASGSSPPSAPPHTHRAPSGSGLTQMMEKQVELVARESQVATWYLKRGTGWREVKEVVRREGGEREGTARVGRAEWLSQAELSTCSRAPRLLPRSVYLSHQFSFHALGEDYHALLRRFTFTLPATKIEVRREVEISAYPSGGGENFLQGGSAPRDIRGVGGSSVGAAASFDEPLASALSGDMGYMDSTPVVLPMFPNGTPGSYRTGAYAPIRNIAAGLGEGVTGGFGRLKRGVGRTRRSGGSGDGASARDATQPSGVPLEFEDDADDDFEPIRQGSARRDDDGLSHGTSTSTGDGSTGGPALPPTPPPTHGALPRVDSMDEEGTWTGWDAEDAQAVDDQEQFNDLILGVMDEEQVAAPVHPQAVKREGKKKKVRK